MGIKFSFTMFLCVLLCTPASFMSLHNISPSQFVCSYLSVSTHFHVLTTTSPTFLSACLTITVSISDYLLSTTVNHTYCTCPKHILRETDVPILSAPVISVYITCVFPCHTSFCCAISTHLTEVSSLALVRG